MDQNRSHFIGRLAIEPTLKAYTKADKTEGYRCFFTLAVTRLMDRGQKDRSKRRTNFIPVVTWGDAAKRHATFLAKGTEVSISGELINESVKQEDGSYKEFHYLQANDIQYGRRSEKNATPEQLQATAVALQKRLTDLANAAKGATPASAPATPAAASAGAEDPFSG